MSQDEILLRYVYVPLAALMGAIPSLGARQWRSMTTRKIVLAIFMGATFAMFVTPWAAHAFMGVKEGDARATVALTYLFGIAAHIILPWIIARLERMIGTGESQ
jgi:hypothetical protein